MVRVLSGTVHAPPRRTALVLLSLGAGRIVRLFLSQPTPPGGAIQSASRPACFSRVRSWVRLRRNNLAACDLF